MSDDHSNVTSASNAAPPAQTAPSNGKAVSGFILGLASVLSALACGLLIGVLSAIISLPCSIIGIILSLQSRKLPEKRGLGTAGLVLSICGLALTLIWTILTIVVVILAVANQP